MGRAFAYPPGHRDRRRADREPLLRWVESRLIPVREPMTERALTGRLATLAMDPVGVRRELVDRALADDAPATAVREPLPPAQAPPGKPS